MLCRQINQSHPSKKSNVNCKFSINSIPPTVLPFSAFPSVLSCPPPTNQPHTTIFHVLWVIVQIQFPHIFPPRRKMNKKTIVCYTHTLAISARVFTLPPKQPKASPCPSPAARLVLSLYEDLCLIASLASLTASLASPTSSASFFWAWWWRKMRLHWITPTHPRKKLTAARLNMGAC